MSQSTVTISGGYKSSGLSTESQLSPSYLDNRYLVLDGSKTMSGNLNVGSFRLNNVSTPVHQMELISNMQMVLRFKINMD